MCEKSQMFAEKLNWAEFDNNWWLPFFVHKQDCANQEVSISKTLALREFQIYST